MRAVPLMFRRLVHRSISSVGSLLLLQHQPHYYSTPHLDYTTNLARARAFTFSPCGRRAITCPLGVAPLWFSSIAGREAEGEREVEVLDMEAGTVRCAANYAPLSPLSFIERAAAVYGARAAVVYGERRYTWREARERCVRVAAALAARFGVARGDVGWPTVPSGPTKS